MRVLRLGDCLAATRHRAAAGVTRGLASLGTTSRHRVARVWQSIKSVSWRSRIAARHVEMV